MADALEKLGPVEGVEIRALIDPSVWLAVAQLGVEEHDVPLSEGGLHAGEWETSMLISIHPELVHLERGEPGYTGDMEAALGVVSASGVHDIAANGVVGDPARASAQHGARYWQKIEAATLAAVSRA